MSTRRRNPTTDRAKRYAANRAIEDDKRHGCLFCGSKRFLTVDHLSGDESDGNPANLAWLCKSCNTRKGAAFAKVGIGRRTHQYNPDLGLSPQERKNFQQLGFDFAPRPRERHGRPARKEATAEDRRRKSARLAGLNEARTLRRRAQAQALYDSGRRMNPARIASASQWSEAVAAVLGKPSSMDAGTAAARIRATTPAARRKFATAVRWNPAKSRVPTFEQYLWGVTHHSAKAHDEGGAVIHAVPPEKRKEYARRIAGLRRSHGTERQTGTYRTSVPF